MDDPIKVIHKYKNNNGKVQYHINIFVGNLLNSRAKKVLEKIKTLSLTQSLVTLTKVDREILEENYGEYWYEFFFNRHHIHATMTAISKNKSRKSEIADIYGQEWVKAHIDSFDSRVTVMNISYEFKYEEDQYHKDTKRILRQKQQELEEIPDFTINQSRHILGDQRKPYRIIEGPSCQEGGEAPDADLAIEYDRAFDDFGSDFDMSKDDDLESAFKELDKPDETLAITTKEIKNAISNKAYAAIDSNMVKFDRSNDNTMFDQTLADVYTKEYITQQYIYKDDSIKNIQNKICCGFLNNDKFGRDAYLLPAYQHLWCEYLLGNKDRYQKVMVGKKFTTKNNLLPVDVEPNANLAIYEDLRLPQLKTLSNYLKRHNRVKMDNDLDAILSDYDDYMTYNELYMTDIFNDFGLNYRPSMDELKNVIDVYTHIYYPHLTTEEIKSIIEQLSEGETANDPKRKQLFETLNNNLILENEIMADVEYIRKYEKDKYDKYFGPNYVTQSFIRTYVVDKYVKLRLYRIFNNFVLTSDYPFVQFMGADNIPHFNYLESYLKEQGQKEVMMRWFETTPYGISFKIRVQEAGRETWLSVNITDVGRVDYKIHWKEDDTLTIDDVDRTYKYIQALIRKINLENTDYGIKLNVPQPADFRFAFINTIQKITLPDNFYINHNDLSDFAVYFYPYISVVIEPRKRQGLGQTDDKSKFGTYLLYKRISRFDNRTRIEQRIIYFIRHYEQNDEALAKEISKEFNIAIKQANEEIQSVKVKYPNLKKSRNILKRLEEVSKYKPPGIRVNIQGKTTDRYKLKIDGARTKDQLERINEFMKILMYLYVDTYLYKKPERQKLREKLQKLTNIARRQKKVEVYEEETAPKVASIKQIAKIDTKRFSSETGEKELWATQCQNSGLDKRRRPQWYFSPEELELKGYEWVEELDGVPFGHYQKIVKVDGKDVKLRAIKLALDDTNENHIYYTCDPEENGKHMFVGFLSKAKDNTGAPPTCCFLRDHLYSRNEDKRLFFIKNIGMIDPDTDVNTIVGDQLYILQHGSRVQEGRFAFLPKYLDYMFNFILGYERTIKNHYLIKAPKGAFFKYGADRSSYRYLNAIGSMVDMSAEQLKAVMIHTMKNDKDLKIFTSLSNGDIRNRFQTIDTYIEFLQTNEMLDYPYVTDLLCVPNVAHKSGLNVVMLKKKVKVVKQTLEKEKTHEMYFLVCLSDEIDFQKPTIFIIKDGRYYYPIANIAKKSANSKTVKITKLFDYADEPTNIVRHINEFFTASCKSEYDNLVRDTVRGHTAKHIISLIKGIKGHVIDEKYRSKYVVTADGYLIPTRSSGTDYTLDLYYDTQPFTHTYQETIAFLQSMNSKYPELSLEPVGVSYTHRNKAKYHIVSVTTKSNENVPIKPLDLDAKQIKLELQLRSNIDEVDKQIASPSNYFDERVYSVNKHRYETELYQLFRYHLSYIINYTAKGKRIRSQLIKAARAKDYVTVKELLYSLSNKALHDQFLKVASKAGLINMKGGNILPDAPIDETHSVLIIPNDSTFDTNTPVIPTIAKGVVELGRSKDFSKIKYDGKDWLSTTENAIKLESYRVKNNRDLCFQHDKDSCNADPNCIYESNACKLSISPLLVVDYVNRVTEELVQYGISAHEILMIDEYFVSDIVNYDVYTERPNERVITTSNNNLNKILNDVFGDEGVPAIGKRRHKQYDNGIDLTQYPLKLLGQYYYQVIIPENNTIYRAFANSYYWLMHPFSSLANRNLGYYSDTQSDLADIYKSQVIDWMLNNYEDKTLLALIKKQKVFSIKDYITIVTERINNDAGLIPLYVLAVIYETYVYLFNQDNELIHFVHPIKGLLDKPTNDNYLKKIYIRFTYPSPNATVPKVIESMYPKE